MVEEILGIETRGDVLVLTGELDLATVDLLEAALATAPGAPSATLDLSELAFMDSSGLRTMLAAHKRAKATGGEVVVICPQGHVRRVLDVSGASEVLTLRDAP